MANLKLDGGWIVHTVVDEDFHLTIYVSNEDETLPYVIDEDLGNDKEVGVRFTTEDIESCYQEKCARLHDYGT